MIFYKEVKNQRRFTGEKKQGESFELKKKKLGLVHEKFEWKYIL